MHLAEGKCWCKAIGMELTGTEKHRYCNRNERAEWITGYRSSGLRPALPGAVRRAARPEAACSRDSPCSQPRGHSTANGGLHLTAKPDVPRRPESHHRHGSSACPLVYRMLKYGQQYVDKGAEYYEQRTANSKSSSSERKPPNSGCRSHQPLLETITIT